MTVDPHTEKPSENELRAAKAILRELETAKSGLSAQRARFEREIDRLGGIDKCAPDVPGILAALAAKIEAIETQIIELRLAIGLDRPISTES